MNRLTFIRCVSVALVLLLASVSSGCIKGGSAENCGTRATVTVNVATAHDMLSIERIMLYIYDSHQILLDSILTQVGKYHELNYPESPTLTVLAVANTFPSDVRVSPLIKGQSRLSEGYIALKSRSMTKAPMAIYLSPTDIFMGSKEILSGSRQESYFIPISRQVASMNITARGLNRNSGTYEYVVGTTKNKMAFTNELFGDDVGYLPPASFNVNNEFVAPSFTLYPSMQGELLHIRLLRNGVTFYEVSSVNGEPLYAIADQMVNVLLDFTSPNNINVGVVRTKWGNVYSWGKEFY